MNEADHRLIELFGVLQNPVRYGILRLLDEQPRTVGALQEALDRRQNVISNHLRMLRDHDLVQARSEGSHRIYRLKRPELVRACLGLRSRLRRDPDTD